MTGFEFGLVPVAIIIGFALTQILIGWGKVVRQWSMLQNPGLFLSFTGFAMAGILSHFVGDWAYRDVELHYGRLVLIILPTLAMVLAISVILPNDAEFPTNLREHYFSYARKSSGLFGIGILLSIIPDLLPGAANIPEAWMVGMILLPLGCMAAMRQTVVHVLSHVVVWTMLLLQMSSLTSFGSIQ
jgi:hypothetical protein